MSYNLLELSRFPQDVAFATLYTGVTNHSDVKKQLISGNKDYDFAFINAANIVSMEQVYAALHKCLLDTHNGTGKAKTLQTQLIVTLSPARNIMQALQRFGIPSDGETSDLIVIKMLSKPDATKDRLDEISSHLDKIIQFKEKSALSDSALTQVTDFNLVRKNYKLKGESDRTHLSRLIVGTIQLKGL